METLFRSECGAEVRAATTLPDTEELILMLERIAREEGWSPGEQLRAFAQSAVYFGLYVGGELAGGLHLVRATASGRLPGHAVWPELPPAGPETAHVVMLALEREHRSRRALFWLLCAEMWRYCWRGRVGTLYMEATPEKLAAYRWVGWPLETVGELREHWGEPCYPCRLDLPRAAGSMALRSAVSPLSRRVVAQLFRPEGAVEVCGGTGVDAGGGLGENGGE